MIVGETFVGEMIVGQMIFGEMRETLLSRFIPTKYQIKTKDYSAINSINREYHIR